MSAFRLVVEKGQSKGKFLRLKPTGEVVVGREQTNSLSLVDPQASRKHFKLVSKLGEHRLLDEGSSNGTFVNGERVTDVVLREGDRIALGDSLVYFLQEKDEDQAQRRGPLTGREVSGYRIGRVLGRGGMGTVYEAIQISLERTVALKVLAPELGKQPGFIDRFVAEARSAGRLNHANIVSVFDVGHTDDLYFFSMEYMAGGSLDDLLRAEGPLPADRVIPLLFDAARGLEYASKQGLVHRDIKPDNLMLSADGVVKICDLGLAIFTARQHEVSGTPHYIAPEQALGKEIDARADLYALGVTCYELLSGKTPYTGSSPAEIARKHVEETPPPLAEIAPGVPQDLVSVVEGLMAKDPDQRVETARQLQADLALLARRHAVNETVRLRIDAVAPDVEPSASLLLDAEPVATPMDPQLKKRLLIALAVVLFLSLGVAGVGVGVRRMNEAREVALQAAEADVKAVEAKLEEEPELAAAQASDLLERLEQEGYAALAERARAVVDTVAAQQAEAAAKERATSALRKLTSARNLFAQHEGAVDGDDAVRERLEEILRLVADLIENHADTPSAVEAMGLRDEVMTALDRTLKAQRERKRKQRAARKALDGARSRVRDLLERRRKGCYAAAHATVTTFQEAHSAIDARAGEALLELVRKAASRDVSSAIAEARRRMSQQQWSEAHRALEPVTPPLGFPKLDGLVKAAHAEIDDTRRANDAADQLKLKREGERALEAAWLQIKAPLAERRFGDAASRLRSELSSLTLQRAPGVRKIGLFRVARLEGAQRALETLFAYAKDKTNAPLTLELSLPGGQKKRATLRAYDELRRTFEFQFTAKILRDIALVDATPAQLVELTEPTAKGGRKLFDLACLAWELGRGPDAERAAGRARSLDPSLREALEDQRALAGR